MYLVNYDYFKGKWVDTYGLVLVASYIEKARSEVDNIILVDNGDLLQGSLMGDYGRNQLEESSLLHPASVAMNYLGYDMFTPGNHDFNYGLDFLKKFIATLKCPCVCANVFYADTLQPIFTPYIIKSYVFKDVNGDSVPLKVGYTGCVPPQILVWDKFNLSNNVDCKDMTEAVSRLIPKMKQEGADLVVLLAHTGLTNQPHKTGEENAIASLSMIDGIDAIVFGHQHGVFPGPDFDDVLGVDVEKGTINGVAAVMPGYRGSHIGQIDFELIQLEEGWKVIGSKSSAIAVCSQGVACFEPHKALRSVLEEDHNALVKFANEPVGKTNTALSSYLSLIQNTTCVELMQNAQIAYAKQLLAEDSSLSKLPLLSSISVFKSGGYNDANNYVDIPVGDIMLRHVVDMYPFSDEFLLIRMTGGQLKEWLEFSASIYLAIDTRQDVQSLIDPKFPSHNFDVISDVSYQIDISQPCRYDVWGSCLNANNERILHLSYDGVPIKNDREFLVVTNSYRAYGERVPGVSAASVVSLPSIENRQVLLRYLKVFEPHGLDIKPKNNWLLVSSSSSNDAVQVQMCFPDCKEVDDHLQRDCIYSIHAINHSRASTSKLGFRTYGLDI